MCIRKVQGYVAAYELLDKGSRKVQWKLRTKRVNRFYGISMLGFVIRVSCATSKVLGLGQGTLTAPFFSLTSRCHKSA